MGLRKGENLVLFVGNTTEHTITTAVSVDVPLRGSYAVKSFNSLRGAWVDGEPADADALRRGLPMQLDRKGFCVLELRQEV
jgi:hypothetical protein